MKNTVLGFSSLVALLILAVLAAGGYAAYSSKTSQKVVGGQQDVISEDSASENGWSQYETSVAKWKSFSFSYPSDWVLDERKVAPSIDVRVSGDSYNVNFSDTGKGLSTGPATIATAETISGYEVTFYREPGFVGYTATVHICPDLGGSIVSPTDSREVTDKIIASLKCEVTTEVERPSSSAVERALFYLNTPQPLDNQIPGYDIDRDPFPRDMLYPDGGGTENDMPMSEVSLHASVNDCWIVLDNGIHDITGLLRYTDEHQAIGTLAGLCGKDINAIANASPVEPGSINTARVRYALSPLFIGFVIR